MRFAFHKIRAVHIFLILGICLSFSISILSVTAESEKELFAHTSDEIYLDLASSAGVELVPLNESVIALLSTPAGISCGPNSCLNKINDDGTYNCYELQSGIFGAGTCSLKSYRKRHWTHKHTYYEWTCTHNTEPADEKSVVRGYSRNYWGMLNQAREGAGEEFCPKDTTVEFYTDKDDAGKETYGYYCAASSHVTTATGGATSTSIRIKYEKYNSWMSRLDTCIVAYSTDSCSEEIKFPGTQSQTECQTRFNAELPNLKCPEIVSECDSITWNGIIGTCVPEPEAPPTSIFDIDGDGERDVWDIDNDWDGVSVSAVADQSIFEMLYDAEEKEYFIALLGIENTDPVQTNANDPVITELQWAAASGSSLKDITWEIKVNPASITDDEAETYLAIPNAAYWTNNAFNASVNLAPTDDVRNDTFENLRDDTISFFNQYAFTSAGGLAQINAYNTSIAFEAHAEYTINGVPYNVSITSGFATEAEALAAVLDGTATRAKMNAPLANTAFEITTLQKGTNTLTFKLTLKES